MPHVARIAALVALGASLFALSACGSEGDSVAKTSQYYRGSYVFSQRCAGCHTLDVAGTQGSATNVHDKEHTDGPNFNVRHETEQNVLYAIRNGGFSGQIMPQNIVTGQTAVDVAQFLAHYAGAKSQIPLAPTSPATAASTPSATTASAPVTTTPAAIQ
jgi:mono/diheme cytochrome c family protein